MGNTWECQVLTPPTCLGFITTSQHIPTTNRIPAATVPCYLPGHPEASSSWAPRMAKSIGKKISNIISIIELKWDQNLGLCENRLPQTLMVNDHISIQIATFSVKPVRCFLMMFEMRYSLLVPARNKKYPSWVSALCLETGLRLWLWECAFRIQALSFLLFQHNSYFDVIPLAYPEITQPKPNSSG